MQKTVTLLTIQLLLASLVTPIFGQLAPWQTPHAQLNSSYFTTQNSKPNPTAFDNMIGATGGKEIGDDFRLTFNSKNVVNSVRSFHLMEADLGDAFFPKEKTLNIIDCECDEIYNFSCKEKRDKKCSTGSPSSNIYGFHDYKTRYCAWKKNDHFEIREVYAAIETQIPIKKTYCTSYDTNGNCLERKPNPCLPNDSRLSLPGRKFPDKWYTAQEWGGNPSSIQQNAYNYVYRFAATFCPADKNKDCVVDVLEVGNEPWGNNTPGKEGYHAILRGTVQAMKAVYGSDKNNWRMKLSTAALDARFACDNAPKQYVHEMIPNDNNLKYYFDYLNVHNYPFNKNPCGVLPKDLKLEYTPESPNGGFLALKNMDEWRRRNGMEHARINITEFGWNSDKEDCNFAVGRANQAAYIIRASLLAARFGIHKVFNYLLKDQPKYKADNGQLLSPESPLYCGTGIIDRFKVKKPAFYAIETMVKKLAGKHFIKAIAENYTQEGTVFAFILGDYDETTQKSTPTHLVAWRASDLGVSNNNNIQYPKRDSERGLALTTLTLPSTKMQFINQANFFYLGWNETQDGKIGNAIVHKNGVAANKIRVDLSGIPVVIPFNHGGLVYDKDGQISETENMAGLEQLSCGEINIAYGNGQIKIAGKSGINYPKMELVNITNNQYLQSVICENGTCGHTQTITGLTTGKYLIKVFSPGWSTACQTPFSTPISLSGGNSANPCATAGGDNDGDGICANEDCDDQNPNYPQPSGTPCNDGNADTANDKIQADGCTCLGEERISNNNAATLTCGEVTIVYGNNQITFTGKSGKNYPFKIQLKQAPYTQKSCHNCGSTKTFTNLAVGKYELFVNYSTCAIIDLATSNTTTNPCSNQGGDSDNDGVCDALDCAPQNNAFPKPYGTACNDGDANTSDDKIQADGCTCQGTVTQSNNLTTVTCGEIDIKYGTGTIEMTGLPNKAYRFSIHDLNNGWKEVFSCWSNCGSSKKVTGLSPSKYKIKVYGGLATCETDINLTNSSSSRAIATNVLDLGTRVKQQAIYLEWVAGRLATTTGFIIEKSLDGINFKPIPITVDDSNAYYFSAIDQAPDYGVNYYRIQQTFDSGEVRYSPIRQEAYYLDEASITIFPNPATDRVNVAIGHFTEVEGMVRIFNRLGLEVAQKKLTKNEQPISFDLSTYQNGVYFMLIEAKNRKIFTRQFIVEHGR